MGRGGKGGEGIEADAALGNGYANLRPPSWSKSQFFLIGVERRIP